MEYQEKVTADLARKELHQAFVAGSILNVRNVYTDEFEAFRRHKDLRHIPELQRELEQKMRRLRPLVRYGDV